MDVRLIILAATFALLIVTAVSFISTVVRHRRMHKLAGPLQHVSEFPGGFHDVDTNLDGLDVPVGADAPSASLLTPLRTGEWMPPETPASPEELAGASLSERIASFTPVPDIREPAHLQEHHEDWMAASVTPIPEPDHFQPVLGQSSLAGLTDESPKAPPPPRSVPLDVLLPEVHPQPPIAEHGTESGSGSASQTDDFSAALRALLPEVETVEQPGVASVADPAAAYPTMPLMTPQPAPVTAADIPQLVPTPVTVPEIVPVALPEPSFSPMTVVPEIPSVEVLDSVPELPPDLIQDVVVPPVSTMPTPVPVPAHDAGIPVPVAEPAAVLIVPTVQAPAAAIPSGPENDDDGKEYWEDLLREQQLLNAPKREIAPRPEVKVVAAEVPVPEPEPQVVAPPRPARPVARVRTAEGNMEEYAPISIQDSGDADPRSRAVPEIIMEAPVEMWFGESRVGVKAGTGTYDRFRKYADVLLADLQSSKAASR